MIEISRKEFITKYKDFLHVLVTFFEKFGIHYSLAYGTLLGAYRNNDMIPWDTDIDLYIDSNDLHLLLENEKSLPAHFALQTYKRNEHIFGLSRIVDKTLLYKNKNGVLINCWIDLFDFNTIAQDEINKRVANIYHKSFFKNEINQRKHGKNRFITILRAIMRLFTPSTKSINKKLEKEFSKLRAGNDFIGGYSICRFFTAQCEYSTIKFGNYYYRCFKNCEKYLIEAYGNNFMIPMSDEKCESIIDYYFENDFEG